jgi:hypothetical protein
MVPSYAYPWEVEATAGVGVRDTLLVLVAPKALNIPDDRVKVRAHTTRTISS